MLRVPEDASPFLAGSAPPGAAAPSSTPTYHGQYSDMLIARSTIPGFASIRNSQQGSWFIQDICKVRFHI